MMILHLLRMRRNVNRKVFNDRENVSATALIRSYVARKNGAVSAPQVELTELACARVFYE